MEIFMKKWIAIFMTMVCTLSLAACGSKQPAMDEVQQAIEAGDLTLQDAVDKGYVTQEWADNYLDQRSIPAVSKMEAGMIGDFTTTTISGEEFTKEQLGKVTFFVFLDPTDENAKELYQSLTNVAATAQEQGSGITVCIKNEENKDWFEKAPFPVILYNDSLKEATKSHRDLIEEVSNTGSWYVNGSFASAWQSSIDADSFAETAAAYVEMAKDESFGGESNNSNSGVAVIK